MKKYISIAIIIIGLLFSCKPKKKDNLLLESPSETLSVEIKKDSAMLHLVLKESDVVKVNINLGSTLDNTKKFGNGFKLHEITHSSHNETWRPVYGERNAVTDNYNQAIIKVVDEKNPDTNLEIECRLYDEGVAFRYYFKGKAFSDVVLREESTTYNFDKNYASWSTSRAQGHYTKTTIMDLKGIVERPLVIKQNDTSFLAIGEAGLVNYARGKLKTTNSANSLQIELEGEVDLKKADYKSPWRYVMLAQSPGELLQNNYFIENLNAPNQIEDTSWIKPGKILREVTLSTTGGKACIDFAVKHNLQYIEFDAGWYGHEYEDSEDASTITVDPDRSPGPLDLHKVIQYGKERGIGIILYINQRAMTNQLDQVLPLYKSWGVSGVKYGFVNVGSQQWTIWLHDAVRKAAENQLMVDIHDEYRPTGYSRTYPNLMTQEGIRGDEESPSVSHSITTLFTRMIAGAGDNTNCFLAERVSATMGGKSAQMAKSIMLYSPWQFLYWYDRPGASPRKTGGAGDNEKVLQESQELSFYDTLPTVWDETKVIESHMEDFATMVRKNGENWFLGSLAANEARTLDVNFEFLNENQEYEALIYAQDAFGLKNNQVSIKKMEVNNKSQVSQKLEKNSGLAIIFTPKKP